MAFGFELIITFVLVSLTTTCRKCCRCVNVCTERCSDPEAWCMQVSCVYAVAIGKPHFGNVSTVQPSPVAFCRLVHPFSNRLLCTYSSV